MTLPCFSLTSDKLLQTYTVTIAPRSHFTMLSVSSDFCWLSLTLRQAVAASHLSRWIAARSVSTGVLPSSEAMATNMEPVCDFVSSTFTKHDGHRWPTAGTDVCCPSGGDRKQELTKNTHSSHTTLWTLSEWFTLHSWIAQSSLQGFCCSFRQILLAASIRAALTISTCGRGDRTRADGLHTLHTHSPTSGHF